MPQQTPTLYDARGQRIPLGALVGRAGEGTVLEVCDRRNLVAKVYHREIGPDKASKLAFMAGQVNQEISSFAAWPLELVYDRPGGRASGFLMQRAQQCEKIHELYGVKSRLAKFPSADWRFLVHAGSNLARAFAVMHRAGHVIGDVNEGNVFVTRQATVVLIDCDSFQVCAHGRTHLCEVGVDNYTPPELQGKSFKVTPRDLNHDAFGLAILMFQLLFMGRHPFAGGFLGSGDISIQKAIGEFRFAYGPHAGQRQMRQPPATAALEAVSPGLAQLFERAFSRDAAMRRTRPTAMDWIAALGSLEQNLRQCAHYGGHYYWNGLSRCPWCLVETQASVVLFNAAALPTARHTGSFDIKGAWAKIASVPGPAPAPPLPDKRGIVRHPSPQVVRLQQELKHWSSRLNSALGIDRRRAVARAEIERSLKQSNQRLSTQMRQWQQESACPAFANCLQELEKKKAQLQDLPGLRQYRVEQLKQHIRGRQLQRFLDTFEICAANITGIGPARTSSLLSFGIETAADIDADTIQSVPSFGPSFTSKLLNWRRAIERRFVYKPDAGVDPADLAAVDREMIRLRMELEQALSSGPARLEQIREQRKMQLTVLRNAVEATLTAVVQAEADLRALSR